MAGFFDKLKEKLSDLKESIDSANEVREQAGDIKDTVSDAVDDVKEQAKNVKEKAEEAKKEKQDKKDGAVLADIKKRAAALHKHIVLPEGEDPRVVKAAADAVRQKIAQITLLGNREEIEKANPDVDLSGVSIVDPETSEKRAEYAALLYSLRKAKGH